MNNDTQPSELVSSSTFGDAIAGESDSSPIRKSSAKPTALAKAEPVAPLAKAVATPAPITELECTAATPDASAAPKASSSAIAGAAERDADGILSEVAAEYGQRFNSRLQSNMDGFAGARESVLTEAKNRADAWFQTLGG